MVELWLSGNGSELKAFVDSDLIQSQTSPVYSTDLLKLLREREKLLVTSNFSFSHSAFYPFGKLSVTFIKCENVVCKLFQFGSVYNFVVWERLIPFHNTPFLDRPTFKEAAEGK